MHVEISEGIRSVLIVEDEGLLALMMEDLVRDLGAADIHVCCDLESASKIADSVELDCAILDLRIRNASSTAIADTLARRAIPFLYSTGSAVDVLEDRHRGRPLLSKPFSDDDFKRALLDTWRAGVRHYMAPQGEVARPASTD